MKVSVNSFSKTFDKYKSFSEIKDFDSKKRGVYIITKCGSKKPATPNDVEKLLKGDSVVYIGRGHSSSIKSKLNNLCKDLECASKGKKKRGNYQLSKKMREFAENIKKWDPKDWQFTAAAIDEAWKQTALEAYLLEKYKEFHKNELPPINSNKI